MVNHDPTSAANSAAKAPTNSHPSAASSSPAKQLQDSPGLGQNPLDLRSAVPLHVRPVLNGYREVAELGICSERALRRHIATGRVKRSIIRNGRNLRFVKDTLIDELCQAKE